MEPSRNELPDDSEKKEIKKEKEICLICGYPMEDQHCKLVCPNCGNRIDCSD
jgi:rubrerythrin